MDRVQRFALKWGVCLVGLFVVSFAFLRLEESMPSLGWFWGGAAAVSFLLAMVLFVVFCVVVVWLKVRTPKRESDL